jgi:HTH-type transcriptional regulator / antitoxin HigA
MEGSTMKTIAKTAFPAEDYLGLVRRFPLRRIRTAVEHRMALAIVMELTAKGDTNLSDGEVDYLEALVRFVGDYERERILTTWDKATPLQVLRHLMEEHAMTPAKLGDVLGSRPAATMILKGRREMSKAHIRAAAAHFAVSPGVFL